MNRVKSILATAIAMGAEDDNLDDDFSDFMNSLVDEAEVENPPAEDARTDDEEVDEEETPSEETPPAEEEVTPPSEEDPKPAEPTPPKEEPKPVEEPSKEMTAEQKQELEDRKAEAMRTLTESFAVSEEDANMLLTAPEQVLPRIMAQHYQRTMQDAAVLIQSQINQAVGQMPAYLDQRTELAKAEQEASAEFYKTNPFLVGHEATVLQMVATDDQGKNALVDQAKTFLKSQGKENPSRSEVMGVVGRSIAALMGVSAKAENPKPEERVVRKTAVHQPVAPGGATKSIGDDESAITPEASFIEELLIEQ